PVRGAGLRRPTHRPRVVLQRRTKHPFHRDVHRPAQARIARHRISALGGRPHRLPERCARCTRGVGTLGGRPTGIHRPRPGPAPTACCACTTRACVRCRTERGHWSNSVFLHVLRIGSHSSVTTHVTASTPTANATTSPTSGFAPPCPRSAIT